MKIVIAVDNDKQTIVKKTGQAAYFVIYQDENILEYIENNHGKGNHNHDRMTETEHTSAHAKDVVGLKGCDIILVQAVGENMRISLEEIGLKIKKVRKKDGETADELIKNFLANGI